MRKNKVIENKMGIYADSLQLDDKLLYKAYETMDRIQDDEST